jgi:iron complex outermembrane recepter protein
MSGMAKSMNRGLSVRKSVSTQQILACGLLLGGASVAANALADTSSPSTSTVQTSGGAEISEIVVTASKRNELVQDVAASLTVISGAALQEQQKDQLADYLAYTPGVTVSTSGSAGQSSVTIRGISPIGGTSKVATYIDEAPLGSSGIWAQSSGLTLDLLPFDLDRIEVLRGPQGTLYGASSMGGLLKYVLTTPDTQKFTGDIAADIGVVESAGGPQSSLMGHANIPIIADTLATSVSGFYNYTPGYINNAYSGATNTNDLRQYGGRLALFWQPASNLTVKLNAMLQTTESADDAFESFANPTVSPPSATAPSLVSGGTGFGRLTESESFLQPFYSKAHFYSGTLDWDLGFADFVSATSYSQLSSGQTVNQSQEFGNLFPLVGLPAPGLAYEFIRLDLKKWTQELRLTSPTTQALSWQVGAFYTDERQENEQKVYGFDSAYQPIAAFAPYLAYANIPTTYQEYAVFADLTWTVTSAFDVTGGVRYSKNKQDFQIAESGLLLQQPQSPPTVLPSVSSDEDNTTWMGSARYHFTKDVMLYARAATGYAPGGANTPYPGVPQATVGSEKLASYELGLKSEFLDRRALVDMAVYHIDWKNIQLNALLNGVGYVTNGGRASSDGFELSASYSPIQGLRLGLNSAYTDAHLTSLNPDVSTPFILGAQLENVSKWTVSGTADYAWNLSSSMTAHVGGGVRWIGEQNGAQLAAGLPYFVLPSYTVVDMNASLISGAWTFRLYGNNLSNARAYSYARMHEDAIFGGVPQIDYALAQPRTVGAGFIFRF